MHGTRCGPLALLLAVLVVGSCAPALADEGGSFAGASVPPSELSSLAAVEAGSELSSLAALAASLKGLKVRELKYRLRKRHGIGAEGVLDKVELVAMLAKAEQDAVRGARERPRGCGDPS